MHVSTFTVRRALPSSLWLSTAWCLIAHKQHTHTHTHTQHTHTHTHTTHTHIHTRTQHTHTNTADHLRPTFSIRSKLSPSASAADKGARAHFSRCRKGRPSPHSSESKQAKEEEEPKEQNIVTTLLKQQQSCNNVTERDDIVDTMLAEVWQCYNNVIPMLTLLQHCFLSLHFPLSPALLSFPLSFTVGDVLWSLRLRRL